MNLSSSLPRLRILTWHIHGSYLYYLTHIPHEIYLPVKPGRPEGYGGVPPQANWGENVHEVPAEEVKNLPFDCILFQSRKNYEIDQYEILADHQRSLPRLYLEHDPPQEHPTDTRHWVDDPNMLLVHVTHFNDLMWDSGRTPTLVIEHGVTIPAGVRYTGERARGVTVINNLHERGRRLGADVYQKVQSAIPLDLVGMGAEDMDGLGEVPLPELPAFAARYRFFFNPIRYTSLGLAVCEAMMVGLPIIGLATTEMTTTIENGVTGFVDTNISRLVEEMQFLLDNPQEAQRMSTQVREYARARFHIERFVQDWEKALTLVTSNYLTAPMMPEIMPGETL